MGAQRGQQATQKVPLWPIKLHYFLHGAGGSPVVPFLPIIGKQMGLSGAALGFLLALVHVTGLAVKPIIGGLMDKYPRKKRLIMQVLVCGAISGYLFLKGCQPIETSQRTLSTSACQPDQKLRVNGKPDPCLLHKLHTLYDEDITCQFDCLSDKGPWKFKGAINGKNSAMDGNRLSLVYSSSKKDCVEGSKCSINCTNEELRRVLNVPNENEREEIFLDSHYWLILYVWLLGSVCLGGVGSYQDAFANQMVAGHESGETFGHQRLWASVGWGSSAILVGYMVDQFSSDSLLYNYTPAFAVMAVLWTLDVLVLTKLQIPESSNVSTQNPLRDVGRLLINVRVIVFILYCTSVGLCYGAIQLVFLLLEELGHRSDCNGVQAMKFLQGLCLAINCMAETPIFFYSGKLIKRFGSTTIMHTVLVVFAMRLLYYGMMTAPWQVVFIEWTNGLITGLFYPAMTSIAYQISTPGTTTTTTAVAFVAEGTGIALGSWISGALSQRVGVATTFWIFGFFATCAFTLHFIVQKFLGEPVSPEKPKRPLSKNYK